VVEAEQDPAIADPRQYAIEPGHAHPRASSSRTAGFQRRLPPDDRPAGTAHSDAAGVVIEVTLRAGWHHVGFKVVALAAELNGDQKVRLTRGLSIVFSGTAYIAAGGQIPFAGLWRPG
jgi:hypothetical protein